MELDNWKPDASCIIQLVSITHEIYKSFDKGIEIGSIFIGVSKIVDKVW